ncbi:hypothetical protein NRB16_29070, partial [Pseudomonas sp. LJDD11]|uniref:hypothetical protein n=1 Tax=Pseudomonas sp. LJDD11 TaxID=2931984 RepID=UPI00211C6384
MMYKKPASRIDGGFFIGCTVLFFANEFAPTGQCRSVKVNESLCGRQLAGDFTYRRRISASFQAFFASKLPPT